MRKVANFCDYFVICAGTSDRHVKGIADGIEDSLDELGLKVSYKEGIIQGVWILLDMGDVVVHIFQNEAREFYGLEHLWQEASQVKWQS